VPSGRGAGLGEGFGRNLTLAVSLDRYFRRFHSTVYNTLLGVLGPVFLPIGSCGQVGNLRRAVFSRSLGRLPSPKRTPSLWSGQPEGKGCRKDSRHYHVSVRFPCLRIWLARVFVITAVMGGVLVPALASPSRTISIPQTEARSMRFSGDHAPGFRSGMERFSFAPTHVGFVWSGDDGTAIRYRLRRANGGLTHWRLANEATDLQQGNVHYSGVLAVERSTGIQWRALVPKGAAMGTVSVDYMNTLDGPRVTEQIPAVADASAQTPHIVTRAEWGADESIKRTTGGCERHFYPVQQLFVHHTAGVNNDPDPEATMRAIYYFHTKIRGWCDIGYNFVIGPDGTVYEGRWARDYSPWEVHTTETRSGLAVMGAHVRNFNAGSVGISVMGNFSLIHLPEVMRNSLVNLLAWEADRHNLKPLATHIYDSPTSSVTRRLPYIAGHRDAGATACPGNYLYKALPSIRMSTAATVGAGRRNTLVSLNASSEIVKYGHAVTLSGALTKRSGAPIPSAAVRIYTRMAPHHWHYTKVKTGIDGGFSMQATPASLLKARAVFLGNGLLWSSESGSQRILVTPKVKIHAAAGTVDSNGIVHYPVTTKKVSFFGAVKPLHPGQRVRVRIFRYRSDGSVVRLVSDHAKLNDLSQYTFDFSVPKTGAGLYKAVAKFPSDGDHTAARSHKLSFMIGP
jgi:N-acetylmuramoyl-L-alanine amidase